MTQIEFFDKIPADNIYNCLITRPEKVIFVGEDASLMSEYAERFERVLKARGKNPEFVFKTADKTSLSNLTELLEKIADQEKECVFDITGGDDLTLVAMGMVNMKREEKLPMLLFDARNNRSFRFENGQRKETLCAVEISISENVAINGGAVISQTYIPPLDDGGVFLDTQKMWDCCRINPKMWNTQINFIEAAHRVGRWDTENLELCAQTENVKELMESEKVRFVFLNNMMDNLSREGLCEYTFSDSSFRIKYKNEFVKKCLTKAGQILEMRVYAAAKKMNTNGKPYFADVKTGVSIDWDGVYFGTNNNANGTENEIDVIMTRGASSVFVSCKNGHVSMEELYKLSAVTGKFGGRYAKKVLVMSADASKGEFFTSFSQRAEDMGIHIIDNVNKISDTDLQNRIFTVCEERNAP